MEYGGTTMAMTTGWSLPGSPSPSYSASAPSMPSSTQEATQSAPAEEPRTSSRQDRPADVLPRVGAGDPTAVQECMERYGGLVWSLARRHSPTSADAEDAVQEVFLSLWKNAARFDPKKASEAGFVTMVARRRLIDLFRGRQRRPQTQQLDAELEFVPDAKLSSAESRTEAGLAVKALGGLDPKERQVVLMSTYQGYSHSEIAELTEMPLGTVKTYIRRGLMRVRASLQKGLELEGVPT